MAHMIILKSDIIQNGRKEIRNSQMDIGRAMSGLTTEKGV